MLPAAVSMVTVSPSRTAAAASGCSMARRPRLMQLRWKIRAKLTAITACTPRPIIASGACSRDEPMPQLRPATRMSPEAIRRPTSGSL
jgi:hypothetical protein